MIDPWFAENLICPIDRIPLFYKDGKLVTAKGRIYPIVEGIPIMLVEGVEQTIDVASASIQRAKGSYENHSPLPNLYLETLGISDEEREGIVEFARSGERNIDPVVAYMIGATSGYAYKHLIGALEQYPIPDLRLPAANGQTFLDLGCNWGRWSVAAAQKGYKVVGIDPSLGAIMAARRVAEQLGLSARYLVADARFLPFKSESFDVVFSYSVLQHLSKENVRLVLTEVRRILKAMGTSMIQMPNLLGVRCLYHQVRRGFREATNFDVRYWSLSELHTTFSTEIGATSVSVDCYFGLGLQKSDMPLMRPQLKALITLSEILRHLSLRIPPLRYVADSVYVSSTRQR